MGDDVVQQSTDPFSRPETTAAVLPTSVASSDGLDSASVAAPQVSGQPRRSYLVRHWRGELALGHSFWGSSVIVGALGFITGFVLALSSVRQVPRLYAFLILVTSAASLATGTWALVGNWRSAGRRILARHAQNKHAFWACLVRVLTVLDAGFMIYGLTVNYSIIPASLRVMLGEQPLPPHTLRLLNDGKEIALTGGFDAGTAADLEAMLARVSGVSTIDLSSTGGFVGEAEGVRRAIQKRGLATYTDGLCVSACTLAYIGGNPRYLGPHGRLGFHRYSSPGFTPEQDSAVNLIGQKSLVDATVAPDFAARAFSTPSTDMWYPDTQTLQAAKVVTRMVNGRDFASTADGELGPQEIERILGGLPAFAALKRADPAVYQDAYQSIVDGARAGKSVQQTWGRAESLLRSAETKYQSTAGDEVELQLAAVMAAEGAFMARTNPAACLMLFRTIPRLGPDYAAFLSPELDSRDKAAAAAIILSGSTAPVRSLAGNNALQMIAQLWTQVGRLGYDLAAVGRPPQSAADRRYLCMALSAFMQNMAQLPPGELGPLMRQLAGSPLGPAMPPR